MFKYIVELEDGVFLAPWDGDPGRTTVKENAKRFNTMLGAKRAITKAKSSRDFTNWSIQPVLE